MKKRVYTFLSVVLSILLFVTPVMAGYEVSNIIDKNYKLERTELKDTENQALIKEVLDNKDVQNLINKLIGDDYSILDARSERCTLGNIQGNIAILQLNNNVRIVYSNTNGDVVISAAVNSNNNQKIEVYDVVKGQIYNTGSMELVDNQIKSIPKEGPYASQIKEGIEQNNFKASSHSICVWICDHITSLGCAGFGVWKCAIVCGGPEDWPCILICAAIWWAVCHNFDQYKNCENLCSSYGY